MAAQTKLRSPAPDIMNDDGMWLNPFSNGMTFEQMQELEKYQDKVQRELDRHTIRELPEALF